MWLPSLTLVEILPWLNINMYLSALLYWCQNLCHCSLTLIPILTPRYGFMSSQILIKNTYPNSNDIDLHSHQQPIKNDHNSSDTEAQLRECHTFLTVSDQLDGFGNKGHNPVKKESCEANKKRNIILKQCVLTSPMLQLYTIQSGIILWVLHLCYCSCHVMEHKLVNCEVGNSDITQNGWSREGRDLHCAPFHRDIFFFLWVLSCNHTLDKGQLQSMRLYMDTKVPLNESDIRLLLFSYG